MLSLPFTDNFLDNRNAWLTRDDREVRLDFENSEYVFELRKSSGYRLACNTFQNLVLLDNFEIHTTLRVTYRSQDARYGIAWGLKDAGNFNCLVVTGFGDYYCVGKFVDGRWCNTIPWEANPMPLNPYGYNTLTVCMKSPNISILFNSIPVATAAASLSNQGSAVGFYTEGAIMLGVSELNISSTAEATRTYDSFDFNDFSKPDVYILANGNIANPI